MAAPTIVVRAARDGGMVRLWATMRVDAAPEKVWDVLTDYEGQPRFVPGMTESRVITRNATGSVVALKGWMELLILRFDFDIMYSTRELPPHLLTSRVIRGNVKNMRSEYRLSPYDGGTRLDYVGEVEPEGWLPPLIGPFVIRRQVESQLEAMAQEIERRQREEKGP
jgi:carbon monoxide dehydrogenase subunit G